MSRTAGNPKGEGRTPVEFYIVGTYADFRFSPPAALKEADLRRQAMFAKKVSETIGTTGNEFMLGDANQQQILDETRRSEFIRKNPGYYRGALAPSVAESLGEGPVRLHLNIAPTRELAWAEELEEQGKLLPEELEGAIRQYALTELRFAQAVGAKAVTVHPRNPNPEKALSRALYDSQADAFAGSCIGFQREVTAPWVRGKAGDGYFSDADGSTQVFDLSHLTVNAMNGRAQGSSAKRDAKKARKEIDWDGVARQAKHFHVGGMVQKVEGGYADAHERPADGSGEVIKIRPEDYAKVLVKSAKYADALSVGFEEEMLHDPDGAAYDMARWKRAADAAARYGPSVGRHSERAAELLAGAELLITKGRDRKAGREIAKAYREIFS